MESDTPSTVMHPDLMIGYAKLAEVVATTFFTALVFGFYMAHYALSTGFFTSGFTPLLATVFFTSVLFTIVNVSAKALTPRKDVVAFFELISAVLLTATAAWIFIAFPLNFAHVADVVPAQLQFLLTWISNDIGRIIVALALLGGAIAIAVDSVKLVWRVSVRQLRKIHDPTTGM